MSITITDPALLALFTRASGAVEIKGPDGRRIGVFTAIDRPAPAPGSDPNRPTG